MESLQDMGDYVEPIQKTQAMNPYASANTTGDASAGSSNLSIDAATCFTVSSKQTNFTIKEKQFPGYSNQPHWAEEMILFSILILVPLKKKACHISRKSIRGAEHKGPPNHVFVAAEGQGRYRTTVSCRMKSVNRD
jgi:hypothetical protein